MQEIRCVKCNKLLGYLEGNYQIKCPRCGKMNNKSALNQEHEDKILKNMLKPQLSK